MKARIEFRDKTEITTTKLENAQRLSCMISKEDLDILRQNALDNNTTVSEIVRALIRDYVHPKLKKERK